MGSKSMVQALFGVEKEHPCYWPGLGDSTSCSALSHPLFFWGRLRDLTKIDYQKGKKRRLGTNYQLVLSSLPEFWRTWDLFFPSRHV